ncbi:GGDEF domain-containing phosphodiesterase [Variovorax paradoxus]|uniref:GGDEF domain-containing phosphodiesterase n=1 Tax=Variovorax paradoxus TaxID=34073 RepID=UPI0019313863|nr:EAL domain-containing protein [Variovorax paradoxus]
MNNVQDPLTGLLARQSFMVVASDWLRSQRGPRQRLVIIEVFGLSIINETQGLASGDQILRDVAFWLGSRFDPTQSVLGRWDGNKFVVLYEACDTECFLASVHRASLGSIGLATDLGRQAEMIRLHVGLCDCRSLDLDDLLTFANEALHESGRSATAPAYRFDEAMHRRLLRRQDVEKDLACAIESGAIGLWYQPIFSGDGRRIQSLEALLRWHHPRQGWTSPEEVVHAATLMGMGETLLQHILQEVCHGLHSLSQADAGFDSVPVAMNVSPREIGSLALRDVLLPTLRREGIAPERLRVEITEESALDSPSTSVQLEALSDDGIGIAVDDFGTGYSSLAMLDAKYVRQVKIDRLLIADLHKSDRRRLLVGSIINLGQALGLEVVGEGVETVEEYEHLRSLGCPLVQGYYLARPSPLESLIAQVRRTGAGLG